MAPPRDVVASVLDVIRRDAGIDWTLVEKLPGGHQSGAWRVHAADGADPVLKVTTDPGWSAQVLRAAAAVDRARRAGYPTPAWLASGVADGIAYHVEELVPGAEVAVVDDRHAQALIGVLESQAGLDPDPQRSWSDFVRTTALRSDDPVGDRPAGRRLLSRCRALAHAGGAVEWPHRDLVHGDFRPANILFVGAAVTGVVDIEAIGSGSRAFDYATLLSHEAIAPDAVGLLVRAAAASAGPTVLRACIAHVFVDLVRFVVRTSPEGGDEVDRVSRHLEERVVMIERLLEG